MTSFSFSAVKVSPFWETCGCCAGWTKEWKEKFVWEREMSNRGGISGKTHQTKLTSNDCSCPKHSQIWLVRLWWINNIFSTITWECFFSFPLKGLETALLTPRMHYECKVNGLVLIKMIILSSFTHSRVVPNLSDTKEDILKNASVSKGSFSVPPIKVCVALTSIWDRNMH